MNNSFTSTMSYPFPEKKATCKPVVTSGMKIVSKGTRNSTYGWNDVSIIVVLKFKGILKQKIK